MENYIINCDWLQCYCIATKEIILNNYYQSGKIGPHGYNTSYQIKGSSEYNASYKLIYEVCSNNFKLATIFLEPRGLMREKKTAGIKLANKVLYSSDFIFYLYDICDALGFEIKGLTRLDLAYDCNKFAGGIHPLQFIQAYASVDKKKGYSTITRDHSNRFTLIGSKKNEIPTYEYLRFGSRTSAVCSYIYNKSKELNDVKEKPYIRQAWKEIGLNDKDVWRVEISISCKGVDLMNLANNQIFRLSPASLASQQAIEELFYIYAKQYMSFRKVDGVKSHKYYNKIELFENSGVPSAKPRYLNTKKETGRREYIAYNVLKDIREKTTGLVAKDAAALEQCMRLMSRLGNMKEKVTKKIKECSLAVRWHDISVLEQDNIDMAQQNPLDYLKIDKYDRTPCRKLTESAIKLALNFHQIIDNENVELEVGYIPLMR